MPRCAYVNGRYLPHRDAAVHIEDRGYQFSDGVYEVIACIGGHLADERGHLDRIERSLKELQIAMPVPRRTLSLLIREVARRNRAVNALIYIQVTRGVAKRDFIFPPPGTRPALVITARAHNFDNARARDGIRAVTMPDIRWKRPDIKTIGLLAQALAKQEALTQGAQEAWLVDEKGFVTEGASSNAWIVLKNGTVVTRQATRKILRGVTRTAIMALPGLTFEERAFKPQEAYKAAEAFITGAGALIQPVIAIDGKRIGDGRPGPVTRRLQEAYFEYARAGKKQVSWKA